MPIQSTAIPAIVNFQDDYFTGQSTDGSGEVVLSLTRTPADINNIMVYCSKDDRYAVVSGLSTADLTVTVYKTSYQKVSAITGALSNLPASVSEATTIQAPGSNSSGSATNDGSGGTTANVHSHTTSISHIYQHDHPFTEATSALDLATSESSLGFIVIYKK